MKLHSLLSLVLLGCFAAGCDSGDTAERSYTKSIVREAANDFEAALIAQAEALYPPRESVVAVVRDSSLVPDTEYWYYGGFDGVRLPFAITGDAVAYYSDLIDAIEAGERFQFLISASFEYRAEVLFHESYVWTGEVPPYGSGRFERVYVVGMSLKWSQYCGPECALWINHERAVVFDEGGNLLDVFGDGTSLVLVS